MALTALAIRLESAGPVLFRQTRLGFNDQPIEIWKFRSMYHSARDLDAARQTSADDPRVTRVGRFIRRNSLDELPQIFNVLQGRMSVVGPRPHALKTSARGALLEEVVEHYGARHRVKPGMTGWAQVNGLRGEIDSEEKIRRRVEHDVFYIDNWSLWFDIKVIFMTAIMVFTDDKAY
jgi:lipopolysaccharide/colanic/teichoic acid biosynthesis glycosyltransferase